MFIYSQIFIFNVLLKCQKILNASYINIIYVLLGFYLWANKNSEVMGYSNEWKQIFFCQSQSSKFRLRNKKIGHITFYFKLFQSFWMSFLNSVLNSDHILKIDQCSSFSDHLLIYYVVILWCILLRLQYYVWDDWILKTDIGIKPFLKWKCFRALCHINMDIFKIINFTLKKYCAGL